MSKFIFALHLILLLSFFCFAQKQKDPEATASKVTQKQENSKKTKATETGNDSFLRAGTNLEARLEQTLDVKKAKVGDRVLLTTTENLRQDGRVVVAKGTRLIGRVTEVQQKNADRASSRLGVVFDRLEGKNLSAPISATIVSITQTNARAAGGETLGSDISESSTTSGSVTRQSSGGGLLGGVSNTLGGVANTTTNTVGGVINSTGQTLGGATQTLARTVDGIQISQSAETSVSGSTTLSAANKNLRLEKGVTFRLRLTAAAGN